jgi:hypothetical protein
MKPTYWFGLAGVFLGCALACVETGVRAYVNENTWDKALVAETAKVPDGIPGKA